MYSCRTEPPTEQRSNLQHCIIDPHPCWVWVRMSRRTEWAGDGGKPLTDTPSDRSCPHSLWKPKMSAALRQGALNPSGFPTGACRPQQTDGDINTHCESGLWQRVTHVQDTGCAPYFAPSMQKDGDYWIRIYNNVHNEGLKWKYVLVLTPVLICKHL